MRFVGTEGHEIILAIRPVDVDVFRGLLKDNISQTGGEADTRRLEMFLDGVYRVAEATRLTAKDEALLVELREADGEDD